MTDSSFPKAALYSIIGAVAFAVIVIIVIVAIVLARKHKARQADIEVEAKIDSTTTTLADSFGGRDNIEEVTQTGSRVTVKVRDPLRVDKGKIQSVIPNGMFMGNKIVFVIGSQSRTFQEMLDEKINQTR